MPEWKKIHPKGKNENEIHYITSGPLEIIIIKNKEGNWYTYCEAIGIKIEHIGNKKSTLEEVKKTALTTAHVKILEFYNHINLLNPGHTHPF